MMICATSLKRRPQTGGELFPLCVNMTSKTTSFLHEGVFVAHYPLSSMGDRGVHGPVAVPGKCRDLSSEAGSRE